jgi:DNA-binding NarL/FixJ family response regulator
MVLSEDELKILEIEKNKKIIQKKYQFRQERTITLQEYFDNIITKEDRNRAILKALDDGYRQIEIAKYLNISSATISKVFRAVK